MKVCILGESDRKDDEGMRKIALHLGRELARFHRVKIISPTLATRPNFWTDIRRFSPDIVHYIPGPSLKSFAVMKAAAWMLPRSRMIMAAPLFLVPRFVHPFLRFIKPDLVLAQSQRMQSLFNRLGIPSTYFPLSGFDSERFRPVSEDERKILRLRYQLDTTDFLVLHVGSIKLKRNVQVLQRLAKAGIGAILVGSTSTGIESNLVERLRVHGCRVITKYMERVNELYQLADCYVFPTPVKNRSASVELPLSVLEAAACNLPIVTTRFGALPDIFDGTPEVAFIDSDEQLLGMVVSLKNQRARTNTRDCVLAFSWEKIAQRLSRLYKDVVEGVPDFSPENSSNQVSR